VELKPTTGVQDLFLVFKNDTASAVQPLMTVSTLTLLQ
jgi:hypothetical protein